MPAVPYRAPDSLSGISAKIQGDILYIPVLGGGGNVTITGTNRGNNTNI